MPRIHVIAECPVRDSFRVQQLAGMFDLSLEGKSRVEFEVELPDLAEEWRIGAIVGPSGSGKSTVAKHAYGADFVTATEWPADKAVIECFQDAAGNDVDIRWVTQLLTSVGFSSPPSWIKPYHVLSNGEKFRCDLARALVVDRPVLAYDEFTSVVDRTVAKIGSAAVAKSIRAGKIARKFVAVTCHYDILDWLEADWVLDMATGQLTRRLLRRPPIELEFAPVHRTAWSLFRRHHYLNTSLAMSTHCFAAFWQGQPVAFSAWINSALHDNSHREHRTVVLPDYQGMGIGQRLSEFCAALITAQGHKAITTTSHPAMIHARSRSPNWQRTRASIAKPLGDKVNKRFAASCNRFTAAFQYVGPSADPTLATEYWQARPRPFIGAEIYRQVLAALRDYPGCTVGALARKLNLSPHRALARANELIEAGLVFSVGKARGPDRRAFYLVD